MKRILVFCILIALATSSFGKGKKEEEDKILKEGELLDFKSIKDVLKKDGLKKNANKKVKKVKVVKRNREDIKRKMYNIPPESKFWTFFSEYWVIKNAPILRWDFKKPDYGIEDAFAGLLEKFGYFEKRFKILLLDTPNVTHFALPSNKGETIFLLSVPFIKQLDLSKLEIALLLFEDFVRLELDIFKGKVRGPKLKEIFDGNFYSSKLDISIFEKMLKKYDKIIFDDGFSFQEQYEVTKRVSEMLKTDLKLWSAYSRMIKKIDDLVKGNVLYKDYSKIYPSPEMQLNWINPTK